MEGRGYWELCRNTSEEMFRRTMMESSIGMAAPTIETLGFKNFSQFRTDSEELFKSWLTSGENDGCIPTIVAHQTRQASRRISTDIAGLANQLHGGTQRRKVEHIMLPQTNSTATEHSSNLSQQSLMNTTESGVQANLYLAKAWFHSSQPMTRSRSSELRRQYAAMQNSQASLAEEPLHDTTNILKQEFDDLNGFTDLSNYKMPNRPQLCTFISPSNSSSSTFGTQQAEAKNKVSSVVTMLKGSLEGKKFGNNTTTGAAEDSSAGNFVTCEVSWNSSRNTREGSHIYEKCGTLQDTSVVQVKDTGVILALEGSLDAGLEGVMAPKNLIRIGEVSQEPSQSESSVAAPGVSNGVDVSDGPSNISLELNTKSTENGSTKDLRECKYENLKDNQKKGGLIRYGSVTSAHSVENGDATKKRRVERSRKMAEAKERNSAPAIPSDMQYVTKRCENLEKEVRSLKLNLAFMNRKDSEQTKQIEELQKQNEELAREKASLLEEIERIVKETSKI